MSALPAQHAGAPASGATPTRADTTAAGIDEADAPPDPTLYADGEPWGNAVYTIDGVVQPPPAGRILPSEKDAPYPTSIVDSGAGARKD